MKFKSFQNSKSGSVAIAFGLMSAVLVGCAGLALDYGNALRVRAKMQQALDASVLAAAQAVASDEERNSLFKHFFYANYPATMPKPEKLVLKYSAADGAMGDAAAGVPTSFMGIFGFKSVAVATHATAQTALADLEIVFALDISGSMQASYGGGTRMDVLKTSVLKLIDSVLATQRSGQSIKFGVVPFTMAVNIGTANAGLVDGATHPLFGGGPWAGCVMERPGQNFATDVYNPGATNGSGRWHAHIWPPEPNTGGICLNPSDGTNTGYQSVEAAPLGVNPWVKGPNFNCPRYPLVRLTPSATDVRSTVAALRSFGNMGTTIGPGMGWAFRLLSPTGPFQDGAAFDYKTRKIIIAVTDGEQVTDGSSCSADKNPSSAPYSFDPNSVGLAGRKIGPDGPMNDSFTPYGYLLDSDPYSQSIMSPLDADKELDRLTRAACDTIKARSTTNPIEIYTVAASTGAGPGTRAQSVLSACATDSLHFIYAADGAAMTAAFEAITQRLMKLRLVN